MDRFYKKVVKSDNNGCWIWDATLVHGYGQYWNGKKLVYAHRHSYEDVYGKIDDGMQIDHLCCNRACVNPNHLEQVTPYTNNLRSSSPPSVNARKISCKRGHVFSLDNTYTPPKRQERHCRTCKALQHKGVLV